MTPNAGGSSTETVHLDVHPSVVFKLGADLITDALQALAELIKNCYDADATWANVEITTSSELAHAKGYEAACIKVSDNGIGMTRTDIERGWLTISNSMKREMKAQGLQTPKQRTPLGDKGLGRLGAQRLGDVLTIITRPKGEALEHELTIDWRLFEAQNSLKAVPLQLVTRSTTRSHGTELVITELQEPEQWRSTLAPGGGSSQLQKELTVLLSPYGSNRGMQVAFEIDVQAVDLYSLATQVRNAAELRYNLEYQDGRLLIDASVMLAYFEPGETGKEDDRAAYRTLLHEDGGAAFLEWLQVHKAAQLAQFSCHQADAPAFLSAHREVVLAEVPNVEVVYLTSDDSSDGVPVPADPGPFRGEVDYVTLGQDRSGVFDSRGEFRSFLKSLAGVRVYRDGFGIRMTEDWIGLRKGQTSGKSFYGLRPENTLGYIDISASGNAQLVETTDREGFAVTPYYRNFYELLQRWVQFTSQFQSTIRRAYNEYRAEHRAAQADIDVGATTEVLLQHIDERRTRTIRTARQQLSTLRDENAAIAKRHQRVRDEIDGDQATIFSATTSPIVIGDLADLQEADRRTSETVAEVESLVESLESEGAITDILRAQDDQLKEQLALTWETVSLGLTAEALSHEIAHIADGLKTRTAQLRRYVAQQQIADRRVASYLHHVESAVSGLKRQLAHLNPSLRYMRERRERFAVGVFCQEIAEYHKQRWNDGPISVVVESPRDFLVEINRGKFTQILDNLLLNSEYWLLQAYRVGAVKEPCITIQVQAPYVVVYDNGRGIDRAVEASLFEPFVSTKKRTEGRGIGLYVVTQLLGSEGASITLVPERNVSGNLYKFELDLGGIRVKA
ncbi:ATP-binding protein [Streptomyces sp. NPDC000878]